MKIKLITTVAICLTLCSCSALGLADKTLGFLGGSSSNSGRQTTVDTKLRYKGTDNNKNSLDDKNIDIGKAIGPTSSGNQKAVSSNNDKIKSNRVAEGDQQNDKTNAPISTGKIKNNKVQNIQAKSVTVNYGYVSWNNILILLLIFIAWCSKPNHIKFFKWWHD